MNIVHITDTNTAYMPAMFVHLINTRTKHKANLLQQKPFLFGNPLEIQLANMVEEIESILENADILHFHGSTVFDTRKFLGIKLDKWMNTKKFILQYHGTPQRERCHQFQRSVPLLVSTPEMLSLFKGSRYFPNLIDTRHSIYKYNCQRLSQPKIKICHHFSYHRAAKNTDEFMRAANNKELQKRYEFVFLERMNLEEALIKRAECDIVFDHQQGYYGLVSLEGMLQGLAVINGCSEDTFKHIEKFFGSRPPFILCKKTESLEKCLSELTEEKIHNSQLAGRKFMQDVWNPENNIDKLIQIYERL